MTTDNHSHPDPLSAGLDRLERDMAGATAILLDIRNLLDTRLAAVEAGLTTLGISVVNLDRRLQRIETVLDERLGRNGPQS